jgi:sugar phosphate isomerase/epimerase
MELGIFAKIFTRDALGTTLDAVRAAGFQHIQFNVETAGLPELPDAIPAADTTRIHDEVASRGLIIDALSGTYNMIHPDPPIRERDFTRFRAIAAGARAMGATTLTLCTGTRNTESMWRFHPGNNEPDAWTDLLASMEAVLAVAEDFDLRLAFEPEPGNTINSSAKARRLLDELQNPRLGVVIDAVNTMETQPDRPAADVLDEAFALLSDRIFVAHAKDHDATGRECPTGAGVVPWPRYVDLLKQANFPGPLIMHGLQESEVEQSTAYLRSVG